MSFEIGVLIIMVLLLIKYPLIVPSVVLAVCIITIGLKIYLDRVAKQRSKVPFVVDNIGIND